MFREMLLFVRGERGNSVMIRLQGEYADADREERYARQSRQRTADAGWVRLAEGNSDTRRARLFSDEEQKRGQQQASN